MNFTYLVTILCFLLITFYYLSFKCNFIKTVVIGIFDDDPFDPMSSVKNVLGDNLGPLSSIACENCFLVE